MMMKKMPMNKRLNLVTGVNFLGVSAILVSRYITTGQVSDFFSGLGFALIMIGLPTFGYVMAKLRQSGAI